MFCHNISFPHCCFSLFGLVLRAKHPFCSRNRQHLAITESHDTEVRTTHNAWHCVQVFWQTPMWSTLCDTCRKSRIYELSFPDQRTFIPASWPLPDAIQRKQQTSFSGTWNSSCSFYLRHINGTKRFQEQNVESYFALCLWNTCVKIKSKQWHWD